MKKLFFNLRNAFIRIKIYFSRTTGYVSMFNTTMILFLFLSNLEKYGMDIELKQWMLPLMIFWICFMIFFGYVEDKLGFYRQEKGATESRSPNWQRLFNRLEKIEKRLEKIEKK